MAFAPYPAANHASRPGSTLRALPYAVALGCVAITYLALLALFFLLDNGLSPAAYDCRTIFCSPSEATIIVGMLLIPPTVVAAAVSVLSLVVMQRKGSGLHWAAEGFLAALVGTLLTAFAIVIWRVV